MMTVTTCCRIRWTVCRWVSVAFGGGVVFDVATYICCFIVGCCVSGGLSSSLSSRMTKKTPEIVHVENSHEESDEKHQQTGSGIGCRTQSLSVSKVHVQLGVFLLYVLLISFDQFCFFSLFSFFFYACSSSSPANKKSH